MTKTFFLHRQDYNTYSKLTGRHIEEEVKSVYGIWSYLYVRTLKIFALFFVETDKNAYLRT